MHMVGEQRIAAPRQRVWEALNNPEILRASIPGCQSLEADGANKFLAIAEVKIGPIGARFKGAVDLTEIQAPQSYTIVGRGNAGIAGDAQGRARVTLSEDDAGTLVAYEVEAEVGGRLAQLGGPIIEATAKHLTNSFFQRLSEVVAGTAATAPPRLPDADVASQLLPLASRPSIASVSGFPWAWAGALALALLAGFLLGRSSASDWWVLVTALLCMAAVGAGFGVGRRYGARE